MQLNMSFLKDIFMSLHVKCTLHSFIYSRRDTSKQVVGKKIFIQQFEIKRIIQAHPWF